MGIRIIGTVYDDMFIWSKPLRGVRVLVTGPSGDFSLVTDDHGIYDVSGLPPGHYKLRLESSPADPYRDRFNEGDIKVGGVWGRDLYYEKKSQSPETRSSQ